jgi:hypothetical protein
VGERSHPAADVDDHRVRRSAQQRQERGGRPHHTGEVDVEDTEGVGPAERAGIACWAVDACVVDQDVDAALVLGDVRGCGGDGRVVRHVDADEPRAERGGGLRAPFGVARPDEHGVAEVDEAACGLAPEALVRTGDEGDRHAVSVRPPQVPGQGRLDGRSSSTTIDIPSRTDDGGRWIP